MQATHAPSSWCGLEELRPVVVRFLTRRCRDEHEAEDLAQETLLRAARYRHRGGERGSLGSWVVQIAANVLCDHARREGRGPRSSGEQELAELPDPQPAPGEHVPLGWVVMEGGQVEVSDAVDHLRAAFLRLIERDRAVLSAYYGAGECTASVARECGIRPSLVKVRLFRARKRLARLVEQRSAELRHAQLSCGA